MVLNVIGYRKLKHLMWIVKSTQNWIDVLLTYFGLKPETIAKLRSGRKILVSKKTWQSYWKLLRDELLHLKLFNESHFPILRKLMAHLAVFKFKGQHYFLMFPKSCKPERVKYMLFEIFVLEMYSKLKVKNKIVIDVGAYVGDTSLYFHIKGAKQIYAIEPYPYTYKLLKCNIIFNELENSVIPLNIGLGGKDTIVYLPNSESNTSKSPLASQPFGIPVKVYSLETLIRQIDVTTDVVLKLDCEGCEYSAILGCNDSTLRFFSEIILEYHGDPNPIINKLRSAGFRVEMIYPPRLLYAKRRR